jgi:hypothetical protein
MTDLYIHIPLLAIIAGHRISMLVKSEELRSYRRPSADVWEAQGSILKYEI